MTEALAFHEYGLYLTLMSLSMDDGPSSMNRPVKDEQPGPPFSQRTTGSFSGSLRDSKNPETIRVRECKEVGCMVA